MEAMAGLTDQSVLSQLVAKEKLGPDSDVGCWVMTWY